MAKILVIEDDPGFRKMIELTLTRESNPALCADYRFFLYSSKFCGMMETQF